VKCGAATTGTHKSPFFLCFQFFDLRGEVRRGYNGNTQIPVLSMLSIF